MKKIVLFVMFFSLNLYATQPNVKKINENIRILRVGTTGDYPPLTYYNPQTKKFSGTDIENAKALGKYIGRKVVFIKTSWPTLSSDLMANKFDIAMGGISSSPERTQQFLQSDPIMKDGKIPLVRCNDIKKYDSLEKINQLQVRVIENKGGTNEQFAKKYLSKATLTLIDDNLSATQYLLNNYADVMITDRTEALYKQKMIKNLCASHPDHPFTTFDKIYLLPKTSTELLGQVNGWIRMKKKQ